MNRFASILATSLFVWSLPVLAEDAIRLEEPMHVGSQLQTKMHLVLRGEIQVDKRDEKVAGQALLLYGERVLAVDGTGRPSSVVRFYDDARAKFVIGKSEDPRQLRPELRTIVGNKTDSGLELYSPGGALTSDELELIQDVMDTTQISGILPTKEVKVGDKWELDDSIELRLLDLEEVVTSTIECTLKEFNETSAVIAVEGKIHGLCFGSEVKSNVEATIVYSREKKLITGVEWKQIDSRAPSPVSPAGAYEVTIKLERSAGTSPSLSDTAIANLNTTGADGATLLMFEDPEHRFRFLHDRHWHVTLLEGDRAILRRLEGRDMVAQLNIHVVGENKNVSELTAEQLQTLIIESGEMKIDEVIRSEALPTDGAYQVRLVRARGKRGDVELVQRHYVAQDSSGRQVLFSFLTEPTKEEKLGTTDLALVNSLEFPSKTANKGGTAPR